MTVARSVARNSLVQLAGRGVTMTLSLAALVLVSRYLGPYRFGQFQLVVALLFLVNVSDFGIATVATRHLSTDHADPDELMGNVLTLRAVLGLLAAGVAIGIAYLAQYPDEVKAATAVASASFLLLIFSGSFNAAFAANLRMEYAVLGNVAQAIVSLGGMALVVARGGGLIELLIAYDAGILANSIVCFYFARKFIRPKFSFNPVYSRELLRDSAPIMVAGLVINAYDRIDVLLLKLFGASDAVGYYGFSYRLIDLAAPLSLLFVSSVYPLLSAHHSRGELTEFRRLYQRAHDYLSLAGVLIATGVILFAPHIVRVIGGASYAPSTMSLRILAVAFALIWLSNLANYSLISIGRQGVLFWAACLGLAVNISVNLVLIPAYGKEGAAATTVLTEACILAAALFVLSRYAGAAPSFWVVGRLAPVAAVAAVLVAVLPAPWPVEALLTAVLFAVGVAASGVVSMTDIRTVLRRGNEEITPARLAIEAGT